MNQWRPGARRRSSVLGLLRDIGPELVSAVAQDDLQSLTLKRYGRRVAAVLLVLWM
jgi:hypothetical protein